MAGDREITESQREGMVKEGARRSRKGDRREDTAVSTNKSLPCHKRGHPWHESTHTRTDRHRGETLVGDAPGYFGVTTLRW